MMFLNCPAYLDQGGGTGAKPAAVSWRAIGIWAQ